MNKILHANVNQTYEFVAFATTKGYSIFSLLPWEEKDSYDFGGSLLQVHMLYTTNILVGVGGNTLPVAQGGDRVLFVWDMKRRTNLHTIQRQDPITDVSVTMRYICISVAKSVEIISMNTCVPLFSFPGAYSSPIDIRAYTENSLLCFQDTKKGHMCIWHNDQLVHLRTHKSAIKQCQITKDCLHIYTFSEESMHIKGFSVRDDFKEIACIDVPDKCSAVRSWFISSCGLFSFVHYTNHHVVVLHKKYCWECFTPNIIFCTFLESTEKYPIILMRTKERLFTLQLRHNNCFAIIDNKRI